MALLPDRGEARVELFQLAVLLVGVAVFYFAIIPASIVDPPGFGLKQGLPPSFSARVAVVCAAVLMLYRVGFLMLSRQDRADFGSVDAGEQAEIEADRDNVPEGMPVRGLIGMAAALVFAYLAVPLIGYFSAGFLLLAGLLRLLGETRIRSILLPTTAVMFLIWVLFEKLLSIHLPVGLLFKG